jgi:hypothetical protein
LVTDLISIENPEAGNVVYFSTHII